MMEFQIALLKLENKLGKMVPKDEIFDEMSRQIAILGEEDQEAYDKMMKALESSTIIEPQFERIIAILKMQGHIYEPKKGFISRIPDSDIKDFCEGTTDYTRIERLEDKISSARDDIDMLNDKLAIWEKSLMELKEKTKKCAICKKPVTNKLLNKDGNYFCGNDCEAKYWKIKAKKTKK